MPGGGFLVVQNNNRMIQYFLFAECAITPIIGWLFIAYLLYLRIFKPKKYKSMLNKMWLYSLCFAILLITVLICVYFLIDITTN